jgi:4'-phosphopantetheinyl transferase
MANIPEKGPQFGLRRLRSPEPAISLWLCELDRHSVELDRALGWLSSLERDRAARFGTDLLRNRWVVGRATLRLLLASATGVDPADIRLARGVRGRPELAGARRFDFNVSHTDGVALIALGHALPPVMRIGVDIERRDRVVNADRLARKFLSQPERTMLSPLTADERRLAFLRLWTCKEAMSKATGDALSAPFREIDVDIAGAPNLRSGPPPYSAGAWQLVVVDVDDAHIATAAIWNGD